MFNFFYKEWLKIKTIYLLFLAVILVNLIQIYNEITSSIKFSSSIAYISKIISYKSFDFNILFYTNLFMAFCLGLFQFYKERDKGRIRLHMHLPYSYLTNINTMVFSGLFLIFITFLCEFVLFYLITSSYFPKEIIYPLNLKLFCSFLNAFIIYLATPAILIEPNKIKNFSSILITTLFLIISFWVNKGFYTSENFFIFYFLALIFQIANLYLSFYRYTKGYIK